MTQKRKISTRKVMRAIVSLILIICCVTALSSASKISKELRVRNVEIEILNDEKIHFLDEAKVMQIMRGKDSIQIAQQLLKEIDVRKMESLINSTAWVKDAQVYIDNLHNLHVLVMQRIPIARVFDVAGNSYYIDSSNKALPLSANYVHYTPVITDVPVFKNDSMRNALKLEMIYVVNKIAAHPFWSSQVSHFSIDSDLNVVIHPILGNQKVIIGDTSNFDTKLNELYAFYKRISNRIGWDKYEVLDLRFKNQVVASPALPWKGPVDKAVLNMNWARSMADSNLKQNKVTQVHIDTAVKKDVKAIAIAKTQNAVVKPIAHQDATTKAVSKTYRLNKKISESKKQEHVSPKYIYHKKTN
jgi:cell division protein FtsQ